MTNLPLGRQNPDQHPRSPVRSFGVPYRRTSVLRRHVMTFRVENLGANGTAQLPSAVALESP